MHNKQTENEFRNISYTYTGYKQKIDTTFWTNEMIGKPSYLHKKWCAFVKMNGIHAINRQYLKLIHKKRKLKEDYQAEKYNKNYIK